MTYAEGGFTGALRSGFGCRRYRRLGGGGKDELAVSSMDESLPLFWRLEDDDDNVAPKAEDVLLLCATWPAPFLEERKPPLLTVVLELGAKLSLPLESLGLFMVDVAVLLLAMAGGVGDAAVIGNQQ